MPKKYIIKFSGRTVEMTKPNSTMLIYKIPYIDIKNKQIGAMIPNKFIVYILFGKNSHGKDMIYVGKSKNGIEHRPKSHQDKFDNWTTCYVLTQFKERTFFNDGTIQYLENELNKRISEVGFYNNTTLNTISGTANKDDEDDCDDYLVEAYNMLEILGLDLITNSDAANAEDDIAGGPTLEDRKKVPEGIYNFSRKVKRLGGVVLHGTMEVKNNQFILKAGSDVAEEAGGWACSQYRTNAQ